MSIQLHTEPHTTAYDWCPPQLSNHIGTPDVNHQQKSKSKISRCNDLSIHQNKRTNTINIIWACFLARKCTAQDSVPGFHVRICCIHDTVICSGVLLLKADPTRRKRRVGSAIRTITVWLSSGRGSVGTVHDIVTGLCWRWCRVLLMYGKQNPWFSFGSSFLSIYNVSKITHMCILLPTELYNRLFHFGWNPYFFAVFTKQFLQFAIMSLLNEISKENSWGYLWKSH